MNFTLEISEKDLENSKALRIVKGISMSIIESVDSITGSTASVAPVEEIKEEEPEEESTPVMSEPVEKPKRKRRTKAEMEAARAEEEQQPVEEEQQPVEVAVEPVVEDTPAEEVKEEPVQTESDPDKALIIKVLSSDVCSVEEFRKIYKWKMESLGVAAGQQDEDKAKFFTDFVHKLSEDYGNRLPSKLTDEARRGFIEQFVTIERNGESFEISKCPY